MHECLIRNGFLPPPLNDKVCTMKFMKAASVDRTWCLKKSEAAVPQMCAVKLNRKELSIILADLMDVIGPTLAEPIKSGFRRTARTIRRKRPDMNWMLMVISSLKNDHPIFGDGYVRVPPPKPLEQQIMIENRNGFYDKMRGLPSSQKGPGRRCNLLTKAEREAERMRKTHVKISKLTDKLKKQSKQQKKDAKWDALSSDDEKKKRRRVDFSDSDSDSDSSDSGGEQLSKLNPLATRSQVSHAIHNANPFQAASMHAAAQQQRTAVPH